MEGRILNDVLSYEIQRLEFNGVKSFFRIKPEIDATEGNFTGKHFEENDIWDFDDEDEDVDIKEIDGKFVFAHQVPKSLHKYVIGLKGATKRKIECDTNSEIRVPRKDEEDKPILIIGPNAKSVSKCKRRIDMILIEARTKQQFTHFISIPMTNKHIHEGFLKFKEMVLRQNNARGLDETVFQNPSKLHLTVGTLELLSEEEQMTAQKLLMLFKVDVMDKILESFGSLKIEMKGLEYMNDDPSEVDVLYAKVRILNDETNLLQNISDQIVDYFVQKGIMYQKYDQVKLHVTIMNTLFRRDRTGSKYNTENEYSQKFIPNRETFDAKYILEKFSNWNFGIQDFSEIHLSIRHSKHLKTGYYKPMYILNLNLS